MFSCWGGTSIAREAGPQPTGVTGVRRVRWSDHREGGVTAQVGGAYPAPLFIRFPFSIRGVSICYWGDSGTVGVP